MLREVLRHQEAINAQVYETAPISISNRAASYAEMLTDPTIASAIESLTSAVLANPHFVQPSDDKDRIAVAIAADVEANLRDLPTETILQNALTALTSGFFPHEITWEFARAKSRHFWLKSLGDLDTEQVAFDLDERMNIRAYRNQVTGQEERVVPVEKLWLHRHNPSRKYPAGRSILDAAHRPWKAKDNILRFWGQTLQRYGMPLVFVSLPATADANLQSDVMEAIYGMQLDGVCILPAGVGYTIQQPPQWHGLTFEVAVTYQDAQVVRRLLHALDSSGGSGQTYITGEGIKQQMRTTAYLLKRISRQLCESFTDQVIRPLVYANIGERPDLCPSLMLPPPGETNLSDTAAPLTALKNAGIITAEQAASTAGFDFDEDAIAEQQEQQQSSRDASGESR